MVNLFFVDNDAGEKFEACAAAMCDQHVVKLVLEATCALYQAHVHNARGPGEEIVRTRRKKDSEKEQERAPETRRELARRRVSLPERPSDVPEDLWCDVDRPYHARHPVCM
jgi:hypothetical protein